MNSEFGIWSCILPNREGDDPLKRLSELYFKIRLGGPPHNSPDINTFVSATIFIKRCGVCGQSLKFQKVPAGSHLWFHLPDRANPGEIDRMVLP